MDASAYEVKIAERDNRIKELEAQATEAAKTAEATEALKSQIEELKTQGESDSIEFGNVKFFAHFESRMRPEKRKDMACAVGMI